MSKRLPCDPELARYLGRYEFRDSASDKFWQISWDFVNGNVLAEWGRNGRPPQGSMNYSVDEAYRKVRDKISKGYKRVSEDVLPYDGAKESHSDPDTGEIEPKEEGGFDFMEELKKIKD